MNQKELNEIRRRFRSDKNAITRVYGCYVNGNKEVISYLDSSLGLQSQEETEMYLNILKGHCQERWEEICWILYFPQNRLRIARNIDFCRLSV